MELNCKHENLKDWTFDKYGNCPIVHFYCPDCGYHQFRGKEYTATGWSLYINEEPVLIPETLHDDYSEWLRNLPEIGGNTIESANVIFNRMKYDMLVKLSKKYHVPLYKLEIYYAV
jgi:hypothetical protein